MVVIFSRVQNLKDGCSVKVNEACNGLLFTCKWPNKLTQCTELHKWRLDIKLFHPRLNQYESFSCFQHSHIDIVSSTATIKLAFKVLKKVSKVKGLKYNDGGTCKCMLIWRVIREL